MTAHISRRLVLGAGAALSVACVAGARERPLLTGVNLAGLEFNGGRIPGRLDRDFVSPGTAELDYFHTVGARAIRLPFRWERAQPELMTGTLGTIGEHVMLLSHAEDYAAPETREQGTP